MLVFEERGNRSTRKKPLSAEKRTNKLNPHVTPDLESNPGHIGGRRVLSPLRHPCTPQEQSREPTHTTHIIYSVEDGIEPRPHRWQWGALITALLSGGDRMS